jgi:hypothetical protein
MAFKMMRKIFKYMSVFSLWLAGLTLTAHQIIPHDHHLSDSFAAKESSCPYSHGSEKPHSGFPLHCHAFNDLLSEKPIIYLIINDIQCDDFMVGSYSESNNHLIQFTILSFYNTVEPLIDSEILELSALRAPPSLT